MDGAARGLPRTGPAMRNVLIMTVTMAVLYLPQGGAAHSEACNSDRFGAFVCGEGNAALRTFPDTLSPSGKFAFAWRSTRGLPTGDNEPPGDVENVLIRLADGMVLAKLGGVHWATGEIRANRSDITAVWSPDSRAVLEVANNRWDTYSLRYYAPDGDKAATLDLRPLVEPALRANLPRTRCDAYSFRISEDAPVTLDDRGHVRFAAMLYVPKAETSLDYSVRIDITLRGGQPAARIVSTQRVKAK
jgi:hypothetical protein